MKLVWAVETTSSIWGIQLSDAIERENISLTPIYTERIDTTGAIHRYNFGWVKTHKIIGDMPPDGTIIDQSITGLSGVARLFKEITAQEILPPSLDTPQVETKTKMEGDFETGTFFKFGTKQNSMIRTRAIGKSEVIIFGQQGYKINEKKHYANAIGQGTVESFGDDIEAVDNGITITAANGTKTTTTIKG